MEYFKKIFSKANIIIYCVILCLVTVDLVTKALIQSNMQLGESNIVINGLLSFTFILNKGGAWGIFSEANATVFLGILSLIFAIVMFIVNAFFIKEKNLLYYFSFSLIVAGTIGNMVDRFSINAVRDFINIDFMTFPVFNVADIFLVVGVVLFCIWYLIAMFKNNSNHNEIDKSKKKINNLENNKQ